MEHSDLVRGNCFLADFLQSSSRTATPTGGIMGSVKETDKVCVMAIAESGALTPSNIFSSSVPALARQDRKPQVLAHHRYHHQ